MNTLRLVFFPTPRARPLEPPRALEEWAFVPPRVAEGERPVVRLASGTHGAFGPDGLIAGSERAELDLGEAP